MTTMNVSLPDSLKAFVDEQVAARGYGSSSEYVRELIRRDQDRQQLQALLLAGEEDLMAVDGVGGTRARMVRDGLARLSETSILERYA